MVATAKANVESPRLVPSGSQRARQEDSISRRTLESMVARLGDACLPANRQVCLPGLLFYPVHPSLNRKDAISRLIGLA